MSLPPVIQSGMYVSWNDNGVTLQCQREECMYAFLNGRRIWWEEEVPYGATPEDVVAQADRHRQAHA